MVGARFDVHLPIRVPGPWRVLTRHLDLGDDESVPARVVGLSCYAGQAPTLSVLLDDGAVFYDVPLWAVVRRVGTPTDYEGFNCPAGPTVAHRLDLGPAWVHAPCRTPIGRGELVVSVDWIEANHLAHVVALDNRIVVAANPRVVWGRKRRDLPDWRKLRTDAWVHDREAT